MWLKFILNEALLGWSKRADRDSVYAVRLSFSSARTLPPVLVSVLLKRLDLDNPESVFTLVLDERAL